MAQAQDNGRLERTNPYLRPNQIRELIEEKQGIESTLSAPEYVRNQVQDVGAMHRQLRNIQTRLHEDSPTPYPKSELDAAVRREADLREKFTSAMPTQREMRRAPPGAIDKERTFQRRNKLDISEWKNIRLRLHQSGMIDDHPDAREVANIEQYRPHTASHELNMDTTFIAGQDYFMPSGPVAIHSGLPPAEAAAVRNDMLLAQQIIDANPDADAKTIRGLMREAGIAWANPVSDEPEGEDGKTAGRKKG